MQDRPVVSTHPEKLLIERIREGDAEAWKDLIDRYEGRLTAYVRSRLGDRAACEDVVQETFLGLLSSLPHYDGGRPLENYLFTICSYKLTDHLRREGRRPTVPIASSDSATSDRPIPARVRRASSMARSGERREAEERVLVESLRLQVHNWKTKGNWTKLMCLELLFVRGWANRDVARKLGITEQQVANFKSDFLTRTRAIIQRQRISPDLFPELAEEDGSV